MTRCVDWHSQQNFHCLRPAIAPGPLDNYFKHCEVGCYACDDTIDTMLRSIGVSRNGERWLRPYEPLHLDSPRFESRDARGVYRALESGKPWRVLPETTYQQAMCWRNGGIELWNSEMCSCAGGLTDICPTFFIIPISDLSSCFWAIGSGWVDPVLISCIPVGQPREPITALLAAGGDVFVEGWRIAPVWRRTFHRWQYTTSAPSALNTHCIANVAVPCFGQTVPHNESTCPLPSGSQGVPEYYIDYDAQQHWPMWDYFRVEDFTCHFVEHPENPLEDPRTLAIRNAALAYVSHDIAQGSESYLNLEQLSSNRRGSSPGQNLNGSLNTWKAQWTADPDGPVPVEAPVIATFGNSRLRKTGLRVSVDIVLVKATIDLVLVLHRVKDARPLQPPWVTLDDTNKRTWATAVVAVDLHLGSRATLLDEGAINGVPLTIVGGGRSGTDQGGAHNRFAGLAGNIDDILIRDDDGNFVMVPPRVRWFGNLGPSSSPAWQDIYSYTYADQCGNHALRFECCAVAHGLDGLTVPPWPSHVGESNPNDLWGGSLTIRTNWAEHCRYGDPPCI